ncbi:LOW QUALITY PROTEIN: two-component sensor kinase [Bacillus sp. JCM 19047]|nr:LOW QUALITY PROTEIN: two-component sensor kinase [Bacillus sp. JCM 19047]
MKLRGQLNLLLILTAIVPFITTSLFSIQVNRAVQGQSELYVEAISKAKAIGSGLARQAEAIKTDPEAVLMQTQHYHGEVADIALYSAQRKLVSQSEPGLFASYLSPADMMSNLYELQTRDGTFIYKEPLFFEDTLTGYYEIRFHQGDIQQDASLIYLLTFLFFGCSSAITFYIVQHWFKRNMLVPFTWMKEQMQHIGDGKREVKLHGSTHRRTEVGVLLDDFAIMTAQLVETEREKQRVEGNRQKLIASISHDLRTPLTSIRAYAEGKVTDKKDEYASVILAKTRYMQRLIADLLMYSQIRATSFLLDLQQVDAEELADTLFDGYKDQWKNHHFTIAIDCADAELYVDVDRLIQVVDNLVANAVHYTPEGGSISLLATTQAKKLATHSIEHEEAHVYFVVKDTGKGISPEEQAHVFDSFYQVEKARNQSNESGVGLGLAICRELIQKHGGKMGLQSSLEKGSTFYFMLPLAHRNVTGG